MRRIILLIAVVAMEGCGKKTSSEGPEANAEPKAAANKPPEPPKTEPQEQVPPKVEPKKPESSKTELKAAAKIPTNAFVNTLGMPFVPVPGTKVQFCIWETRVKDYAAYAAANEGVDASWKYPIGGKQGETHPVVMVKWEHAQAFCAWLTKKELAEGKIKARQKYRLPTDAEWSVAVGLGKEKGNTPAEKRRSGIKGEYPWGKEWPPPNGAGNYGDGLRVDNFDNASPITSPVGSFAPNKLGLHDLGGNVWEWCDDKWRPTSDDRVLRGASWYDSAEIILRSSERDGVVPIHFNGNAGFRCVLVGK